MPNIKNKILNESINNTNSVMSKARTKHNGGHYPSKAAKLYTFDTNDTTLVINYFSNWIKDYCLVNYSLDNCSVKIIKLEANQHNIVETELSRPETDGLKPWILKKAKKLRLKGYFFFVFSTDDSDIDPDKIKYKYNKNLPFDILVVKSTGGSLLVEVKNTPVKTNPYVRAILSYKDRPMSYFDRIGTIKTKNPQGTYSDYLIRNKYLT